MPDLSENLPRLHRRIDRQSAQLRLLHANRLQCRRGCAGCCIDDLSVFEVEAEHIRRHHADLLDHGTPHPEGACAFLDEEGACRIYAHRPYVCRTQGLPLRWTDQLADGTLAEFRDICPLNDQGRPIEALPADHCWSIGPTEAELARMQNERYQDAGRRVALRSLFAASDQSVCDQSNYDQSDSGQA